jgi:hypothetical protein
MASAYSMEQVVPESKAKSGLEPHFDPLLK